MKTQNVTNDFLLLEFTIVNACILGNPDRGSGDRVLVDAAIEGSADAITKAAEERFGKGSICT